MSTSKHIPEDKKTAVCGSFFRCTGICCPNSRSLAQLGTGIQKLFGILPAKTGICDGFAIYVVGTDLLAAFYQIAFDHHTFYQLLDVFGYQAAVEHFLYDADLLLVLFAGVGMIGVNDHSR